MIKTQDVKNLRSDATEEEYEGKVLNEVQDLSSLHKYRTEMPNIVEELDLDPYEYRLYCKYKRIAGDRGMCIKSNRKLAEECKMSVRKLQQVKQALAEPRALFNGKSLIKITERRTKQGDPDTDLVAIVDIWPENFLFFIQKSSGGGAPAAPGVVHLLHQGWCMTCMRVVHQVHPKKNIYKKNLKEELQRHRQRSRSMALRALLFLLI